MIFPSIFPLIIFVLLLLTDSYPSNNEPKKRIRRSYNTNHGTVGKIGFGATNYCISTVKIKVSHKNGTFDNYCKYRDKFLESSDYCMVTLVNLFWSVTSGYCAFCANSKYDTENFLNIPVRLNRKESTRDPYQIHFFAVHPDHEKSKEKCENETQIFGVNIGLIKTINAVEEQLEYSLVGMNNSKDYRASTCVAAMITDDMDERYIPWNGRFAVDPVDQISFSNLSDIPKFIKTKCVNNETLGNFFLSKHNGNEPGLKKTLLGSPMICNDHLVAVLAGTLKEPDVNTSEVYFVWTKVNENSYDWLVQVMDAYTRSDVMQNRTDASNYDIVRPFSLYIYLITTFYVFIY